MRHPFALLLATLCLASSPLKGPPAPPLDAKNDADTSAGVVVLSTPIEGSVLVPAGSFEMGSGAAEQKVAVELCRKEVLGPLCRDGQFADEGLPHFVTLGAYWIDRTEVTVAAYGRCVSAGACLLPSFASGDVKHDRPDFPVTFVGWEDAQKFCAWRRGRLPTEAEWERAARGISGRRYPWGMLPNPMLANHGVLDAGSAISSKTGVILLGVADGSDGFVGLAPVATFKDGATPDGLQDLAGNVAEWVADLWDDAGYAATPVVSPTGPTAGVYRVIRGGSYRQPMAMLRAASRFPRLPSTRDADIGFRCARDP